jgi:hypothetical protein
MKRDSYLILYFKVRMNLKERRLRRQMKKDQRMKMKMRM